MSAYQLLTPDQLKHVLSKTSPHSFAFNTKRMNSIYKLPINTEPTLDNLTKPNGSLETAVARQIGFLRTLRDECSEGDEIFVKMRLLELTSETERLDTLSKIAFPQDIVKKLTAFNELIATDIEEAKKDLLTDMADWLSDIMVYCRSEGMKYGLPIEETLEAVMGSNFTKLPSNGIPIHDANGKFLKDMSNYVAPEGAIKTILFGMRAEPIGSSEDLEKYDWEARDRLGVAATADAQAESDTMLAKAQEVIGKSYTAGRLVHGSDQEIALRGTSDHPLSAKNLGLGTNGTSEELGG